jgi:2-polyprenyl-6-methoxyphenol hydroxylase-like FAD-dependent oxidoreductase
MAGADYDIVTVGGGLGGAALAKAMAERGARVLVLEREVKFKDRVRGEGMTPWGSGEARELGIYDLLVGTCGHEVPWWDMCIGPMVIMHREMPATTPQGLPTLAFYHPNMQETLLAAAGQAGAEVRRGVRAKSVTLGKPPSVEVEGVDGKVETINARLVVAADGRGSLARKWGGFAERRDRDRLRIAGLYFEDMPAPDGTVRLVIDLENGTATILFPLGRKRARVYDIVSAESSIRFQGDKDVPKFIEQSIKTGMPAEYFEGAKAAGPLATFDGADCWVEHPYKEGLALIGDAAGHSDPSWGQGLALTLSDVRELRDALVANDDWDAAGHAYAAAHDRNFGAIHTADDWLTQFFYETGPEANARRERAFPLIAQDPTRVPDVGFSGPYGADLSEGAKRRFFGEE